MNNTTLYTSLLRYKVYNMVQSTFLDIQQYHSKHEKQQFTLIATRLASIKNKS